MGKFKMLDTDLEEGILTITLNRPEKSNSLTTQMINDLRTIIQNVYDDDAIKSVIITGAGEEVFSIGEDWQELHELHDLNGRKFSETGQETLALIENCHKPIMAGINGTALGGGLELALACHLRIAARKAIFGFPEVTRGIVPGFGGTQRLTYVLGKTKALELLLTGDTISAEEAESLHLVNHVASHKAAVIEKCREILHRIMNNPPLAIGGIINCTNAAYHPDEDGYQTEANTFANCFKSEDFSEGIEAFLHQRPSKLQSL
jgi:enoyl-CoA hydratase